MKNINKTRLIKNKLHFIIDKVKWKSVADLWCMWDFDNNTIEKWIHLNICKNANMCYGIDPYVPRGFNPDDVKWIKLNIVKEKIEDHNPIDKYDLVFAWEIIEHISEQKTFVDSCKKLIKDNWEVIITTPNSTSIREFLSCIFRWHIWREIYWKIDGVYLSGHVVIHNITTLKQLFDESWMEITEEYYYPESSWIEDWFLPYIYWKIFEFFYLFRPIIAPNIIIVAKIKNN